MQVIHERNSIYDPPEDSSVTFDVSQQFDNAAAREAKFREEVKRLKVMIVVWEKRFNEISLKLEESQKHAASLEQHFSLSYQAYLEL